MDLISREKVKNTILDFGGFNTWEDKSELMYEISFVPSAFEGMTNGEVIISLYPNLKYTIRNGRVVTTIGVASSFDLDWWNAPYKAESEVSE